jgi:hypothetical protein
VPTAAIERAALGGSRAAASVLSILRDPRRQDRYIATAQVGITWVSTPMRWINRLLWPLTEPLEAAGNRLSRWLGIVRGHTSEAPTAAALRFMVDESVQRGELGRRAGEVLQELFAFSELSAAEVMLARQRVVALPAGATIAHMQGVLRSAPHSRYPVFPRATDARERAWARRTTHCSGQLPSRRRQRGSCLRRSEAQRSQRAQPVATTAAQHAD